MSAAGAAVRKTTLGSDLVLSAKGLVLGVTIKQRLEYLRRQLRAERISYGELVELQSLAEHIDPSDVELLEAAGVPEEGSHG